MALDQQETFNWLVAEKSRLEGELDAMRADRDKWAETAFDLAFKAARDNPGVRAEIERCRQAETPDASVLGFVLRDACGDKARP